MSFSYYIPPGYMAYPYYVPGSTAVYYPDQNYYSGGYPDQNYHASGYPDQNYQESVELPIQVQPTTGSYQGNVEQPIQVQPTTLNPEGRDSTLHAIARDDNLDPEQRGLLAAEYLGSWLGDQINRSGWLQCDPKFKSVFFQPPAGHPPLPGWNAPAVNAVEVAQESALEKQRKDVKSIEDEEGCESAMLADVQAYYEDMATKTYRIKRKNEKPPRPRKKNHEMKSYTMI